MTAWSIQEGNCIECFPLGADPNAPLPPLAVVPPLHVAVTARHLGCLRRVLRAPGAVADARDRYGRTASHVAALSGLDRFLRELRSSGADPESTDARGRTPGDYFLASHASAISDLP